MRAIIIAAGKATRWNNYLGKPKHLIEIDGEPILHRTVRLLRERGVSDVHIVALEMDYFVEGAKLYIPTLNYEENADADKFLSSKELWSKDGRTIVLYGDCFFTENAIDKILSFEKREWTLFCRPKGSVATLSKHGECFAQSFYPEHLDEHEKNLHLIAELAKTGVIDRCGGWEHYRAMTGRTGARIRRPHTMTTNWVEINDWTEDFDYPEDYDNFIKRYRKSEPDKIFETLGVDIKPKKLIHIGAYLGREAEIYKRLGIEFLLVEPIPKYADYLRKNGHKVLETAVDNSTNRTKLFITTYDQASSILKPTNRKIEVAEEIEVSTLPLKDFQEDYDTLVIDVQGATLNVLESADLSKIQNIIYEASFRPRYEGEANSEAIVGYLEENGFRILKNYRHGVADVYDYLAIKI